MHRKLHHLFHSLLLLMFLPLAAGTWNPEATMKVAGVSDIHVSPDGQSAIYRVTRAKGDDYVRQLHIATPEGSRPLTAPELAAQSPRWSPDGTQIAFLAPKNEKNAIHLYSVESDTLRVAVEHNSSIQCFLWAPDGQSIAFVAADERHAPKGITVFEDDPINRLWVASLSDTPANIRVITPTEYHVRASRDFGPADQDLSWSPDGAEIAFAHSPTPSLDDIHMLSQVAVVNVFTRAVRDIAPQTTHESVPRFSHDGRWIAYLTSDNPTTYSYCRYVMVVPRHGPGQPRRLATTPNEGPCIGDVGLLGWLEDDSAVLFEEPYRTRTALYAIPIDGTEAVALDTCHWTIDGSRLNQSGSHVGLTLEFSTQAPGIGVLKVDPKTHRTEWIVKNFDQNSELPDAPKTLRLSWTSFDGQDVEGLLTLPANFTAEQRHPMVVLVHGGPMGCHTARFTGRFSQLSVAAFADAGYLVLRPNPRGSTGYGRNFRTATYGDWGGCDYQDIITGVDAVIADGKADPDKLVICGWSYGGYMTAWAITQTDRFRAASMGAGISNLISDAGTTDIHRYMADYMQGDYTEQHSLYWERSPIAHIRQVKTPCLIQHGATDTRVPLSQGLEFYRGLQRHGVSTQLVIYQDTTHWIAKPAFALDALQRNIDWFDKAIKA